jgi:hypothetical protein
MYQYIAILLILFSQCIFAETILDCNLPEDKVLTKFSAKAKRLTVHQLQVSTSAKKVVFNDKYPYAEGFSGTKWAYCGYSATLKMHLVTGNEDDTFIGTLVDDVTGKQLPAGYSVQFSDDSQLYAAFVQPDGLDGMELYIYQRNGQLLWKGYDFIEGKKDTILAVFDSPKLHWNKKNQFEGMATCISGKEFGLVALTRQNDGHWKWLPEVNCELQTTSQLDAYAKKIATFLQNIKVTLTEIKEKTLDYYKVLFH